MSRPLPEIDEALQLDLVAYLDGELEPEQARRVEQLLYNHPAVQEEVRKLEASWDLLEELPQTQVDEQFTQSTVELVIADLTQQLQSQQQALPRQARRWWLLLALVLGVAAFATVAVLDSVWLARERHLSQQLPLLQRLEQYEEVRDIQFLEQMIQQKLVPILPPQPQDWQPRSDPLSKR